MLSFLEQKIFTGWSHMQLDEKKLNEIKANVQEYIKNSVFIKEKDCRFVDFFLNNSKNSIETAKLLFEASANQDLKEYLGVPDFDGFLWVINSGYYSMFYAAKALLESIGLKIKERDYSVHKLTFEGLVYYFYLTGKLERKLIESFAESASESAESLGKEKAKQLIEDYMFERSKRSQFTYEMGLTAIRNKAQTSLDRAKVFVEEIRKILGR